MSHEGMHHPERAGEQEVDFSETGGRGYEPKPADGEGMGALSSELIKRVCTSEQGSMLPSSINVLAAQEAAAGSRLHYQLIPSCLPSAGYSMEEVCKGTDPWHLRQGAKADPSASSRPAGGEHATEGPSSDATKNC